MPGITPPLNGGNQFYYPFLPGIPSSGSGSGVTGVTATLPIISSGGTAPNISLQIPLPVIDGGTGTTIPTLIAGTGISITGPWPDQTINATNTGTVTSVTASAPITSSGGATPNIALTAPLALIYGGNATATPSLVAGTNTTVSGTWPAQSVNVATGAGGVTAVTGSGNIASSGGTTPNITLVNPPTISGANITAATIPLAALVAGNAVLAGPETFTGVIPFSSPPVMSGASITTGTVPDAALVTAPVTAVTGTAPITSSGGTTPVIALTTPLAVSFGGNGTATPTLTAGTNVTITGTWPNLTINASSSGGSVPLYNPGGTLETPHNVLGQVSFATAVATNVTSSAITLTGSAAFTGAATYEMINCTIDGSSSAGNLTAVTVGFAVPVFYATQASGSSFTITAVLESTTGASKWGAAGTLVLNYELVGY